MLCSDSSLFLPLPGLEMIMFVVIKQSLFDQELSDTECVQVAAWHWCWTGAQTQKLPRLQSPCQVFSPGAGSAPTTVYQEISWHCTIATTERGRPATMQLQLQLQIYLTIPHFTSLYLTLPRASNLSLSLLVFQTQNGSRLYK